MTSPGEAGENPGSQRQMDQARDPPPPNSNLRTGNKEIRTGSQQSPPQTISSAGELRPSGLCGNIIGQGFIQTTDLGWGTRGDI